MIFLHVILIINTLVANISCTIFVNGNVKNLKQKDAVLETTINLLKNTVDENQAKIQLLNLHIEELEMKLQEKQLIPKLFKNHCLANRGE